MIKSYYHYRSGFGLVDNEPNEVLQVLWRLEVARQTGLEQQLLGDERFSILS